MATFAARPNSLLPLAVITELRSKHPSQPIPFENNNKPRSFVKNHHLINIKRSPVGLVLFNFLTVSHCIESKKYPDVLKNDRK